MTQEEFKDFWTRLKTAYPYDFKDPSPEWYKILKDTPFEYCCNALHTRVKDYRGAPNVEDIYESATKYKGYPSLLYKAVMRRRREVEP